jgi:hypothetical protein
MVLDTMEESLPSIDQFGIFHIRRGDAIGECDTTLNKIRSYLSCSLENLEVYGKTSLLFISDETDTCYRNAIQDMVESLGFHFIDLDDLVKNAVLEYASTIDNGSRLVNNMFTFKIERELEWNPRVSFKLSQRRSECASCDKLHSSSQFKDRPVTAMTHAAKKSVDLSSIQHAYNMCKAGGKDLPGLTMG